MDCQRIIDVFIRNAYTCYYSPLAYLTTELNLNYKFNPNGLKIFIRKHEIAKEHFSFSHQRNDGRMVVLKTDIDFYKPTTLIFLHNKSKSGNLEVTDNQRVFISELKMLINLLKMNRIPPTSQATMMENYFAPMEERFIIIGDFNLEPWDTTLRQDIYLNTHFFSKHNEIRQRMEKEEGTYFNPIVELILKSDIQNLGGTYYSDSRGWALFDFVLYDTKNVNISYNIITEFTGGSKLLDHDTKITKSFINNELDHLPIVTKINN
jgi:hypothetical protein